MKHEEVKGQLESITHWEMGVEETLLEELVGIRDFQVKEGVLPEEMVIKEEGEVMMTLTLVMMGMGMTSLPPQTPLSQRKENRRDLNMFMYFKDLLVQKVKKVNLDKQEEMVGMGRISPPKKRKQKGPKYVYVLQGPPGPKGQEGQPGQAGRDGRDGQNLSLMKELEETLKAHKPNLDTTGLENSFDQFSRTIFEVLSAQQRTNQKLEEQFLRVNETQEYQVEAMQDMARANFQMKYDHMFAGVPMYDGADPDSFDDWLYQIESLCEISHRDVRVELMG